MACRRHAPPGEAAWTAVELGVVAGGDIQEAGDRGRAALGVQVQEAGELRLGGFDQLRPGLEQAAVLASKIMVEETTSPSP